MQIGDYEIKNVNFPGSIIIFQRDIACLNWIQVIFSLKKNFFKNPSLMSRSIDKPGQMKWWQFYIKYLELILVTLSLITPVGAK